MPRSATVSRGVAVGRDVGVGFGLGVVRFVVFGFGFVG